MFGQSNSAQSGGLFGAKTATSNTSGFSFGGANTTNNNAPQQSTGGFSFGGANNTTQTQNPLGGNTGNSLFGNNNANQNPNDNQSGGLLTKKPAFGTTNTTGGSLFGSNANNSTTTGATNSLFGATTNTTTNNNTQGGGLFGKTNTQPTTGGLFGATTTTNQPTTSSLFGGSTTTTTQPATGGLFANKPATTGGLFGTTQPTSTTGTAMTGGMFGPKPVGSGGLFNNQTQQPQQPQQQSSLVGGNNISSANPSFAWSKQQGTQPVTQPQNNLVAQQQQIQLVQQQLAQQQNSNYSQQIKEQLIKCKESWDPTSSTMKLKSFVYNKVTETEALLYNNPQNISQDEWNQALEGKPSNNYIPIQILGFEDLYKRNQLQRENVAQCRTILNQLLEKTTELQQKHELDTASRILKAQTRNIEIEKRILRLGSQIAILKSRGLPLSISEEKLWVKFQALLDRSKDPAGLGKTNELWSRLAALKERTKTITDRLDSKLVIINQNGGEVANSEKKDDDSAKKNPGVTGEVDEELEDRIDKITTILSNQQRGIVYLNEVLEKDNAYLDKLRK